MRLPRTGPLLCALLLQSACAARAALNDAPRGVAVPCSTGMDSDQDGLSDDCETAFARAFAPLMRVAPAACNRDSAATDGRLAGEYLFGVRPAGSDTIRIVYLPAYHEDCGWRGFKCRLGITSCRGHPGDSELIALTLRRDGERWQTTAVFLSAHCFGRSDALCRWYAGSALHELAWAGAKRGAPIVWVAEGKNANYPSRPVCDTGHWFFDSCDRNRNAVRFPVDAGRNIGSAAHPIGGDGCVTRAELAGANAAPIDATVEGTSHEPAAAECFWSDIAFTGWQQQPEGAATPYAHYLRMVFEGPALDDPAARPEHD